MNPLRYAFVFVCQQGELEGLALLLAASLKRFLTCEYELIAAIPKPATQWGSVSPVTLALFATMGVRVEYFENPIARDRKGNPLTNKIYCFQVPTTMDKVIFLDSDILCLRPFGHDDRFLTPFNAAPTFLATGGNWEQIYQAVNLPMPTVQMKTLFSDELQPPYFNSGVVAIDAALAPDLADMWLDTFAAIDRAGAMAKNPYFREQVSLVVSVLRLGLEYDTLDERYNYWVKFKPLEPTNLPYFLHHTWPHPPIYHQPLLNTLVRSLVQEYPAMRPFVARCRWKYYLRPTWMVGVNRWAYQNRRDLEARWGSPVTHFLIHGHNLSA